MTKTVSPAISLLNAQNVAAASAGTKGAPGAAGGWVDVSAYDGGEIYLAIQNSTSAPNVAGQILIQASPDNGTNVTDYWGYGGTTDPFSAVTLAGQATNTVRVDAGVKYLRVIGYGHTVNPVSYTANFTGVTRS